MNNIKTFNGLGFNHFIKTFYDEFCIKVLKEKEFGLITEEMKTSNQIKMYLIEKEDKFRYKDPFYVVNKDFIIDYEFMQESPYEKKHLSITRNVYDKSYKPTYNYKKDKKFKPLIIFSSVENPNYITEIKTENISYETKNENFKTIKEILEFKIKELGIVINAIKTHESNIEIQKGNNLKSISLRNNSFTVNFNNCTYKKIKFDYNFNIIEMDFSSVLKKKLNVDKIFNINSYEDFINRMEEYLNLYKLTTDKNYIIKTKEKEYLKQLDLIKLIIKNKDKILELSDKLKKEIKSLKLNYYLSETYKLNLFLENNHVNLHAIPEKNIPSNVSNYKRIMQLALNSKGTNKAMDLDLIDKIFKLNDNLFIEKLNSHYVLKK